MSVFNQNGERVERGEYDSGLANFRSQSSNLMNLEGFTGLEKSKPSRFGYLHDPSYGAPKEEVTEVREEQLEGMHFNGGGRRNWRDENAADNIQKTLEETRNS